MTHWRTGLFAVMLASAGLPIYIHLPRYAAVEMGLDIATVGLIVMGIRIFDFIQDPLIGRLIDRFSNARDRMATLALALMALGFIGLFSLPAPVAPALWLVGTLVCIFTGYSVGMILMYGDATRHEDQLRIATYREAGLIVGVILAALAPTLLGGFTAFGWLLAVLILIAHLATRSMWGDALTPPAQGLGPLFKAGGGWLLLLAVVNSLPLAITSTLFLFYVSDRLLLPDWAGGLLVLFFASSGLSIPIWSALARRFSPRAVLLFAMALSIAAFIGTASIPPQGLFPFALVCIASGAAVGAELVILPTLFSGLLARNGIAAGQSFGLWSFATKLSLPLAAVIVLPTLDAAGFVPDQTNSAAALDRLSFLYALLPCALKLLSLGLLLAIPKHLFGPPQI